jgi:hypothetical protein
VEKGEANEGGRSSRSEQKTEGYGNEEEEIAIILVCGFIKPYLPELTVE